MDFILQLIFELIVDGSVSSLDSKEEVEEIII